MTRAVALMFEDSGSHSSRGQFKIFKIQDIDLK